MQQWRVLAENQTRPDPRKQTLLDLKKFLQEETRKGRELVIGIDANEGIENRTDEMLEMINANKLIDLHAREDPMSEIETYIRGRQRIDYAFATERVAECVTYTNIAPYNEGIVSDHRALVVDIDIRRIQQGDLLRWERIARILRPG